MAKITTKFHVTLEPTDGTPAQGYTVAADKIFQVCTRKHGPGPVRGVEAKKLKQGQVVHVNVADGVPFDFETDDPALLGYKWCHVTSIIKIRLRKSIRKATEDEQNWYRATDSIYPLYGWRQVEDEFGTPIEVPVEDLRASWSNPDPVFEIIMPEGYHMEDLHTLPVFDLNDAETRGLQAERCQPLLRADCADNCPDDPIHVIYQHDQTGRLHATTYGKNERVGFGNAPIPGGYGIIGEAWRIRVGDIVDCGPHSGYCRVVAIH